MFRKLHNNQLKRVSLDKFITMPKMPLVILLDNVRSQHNIGSAFRTADAFAAEAVILCGICATPPSAEIRKAALGAEESIKWEYYQNSKEALIHYKEMGYTVLCAEQTENSVMLNNFTPVLNSRYLIVFGNEVKGVSQELIDLSDGTIEIPQYGTKHSLNVSVSIGIVLWDISSKLKKDTPDD